MKEGGQPIYTGEEGREITRYTLAAYVSAQENRDVYLDEITTEAEEKRIFEINLNRRPTRTPHRSIVKVANVCFLLFMYDNSCHLSILAIDNGVSSSSVTSVFLAPSQAEESQQSVQQ